MKLVALFLAMLMCISCSSQEATNDPNVVYKDLMSKIKPNDFYSNEHRIILVDFSRPSNTPRMFVWDMYENKIEREFWCAHGFGGGSTDSIPVFSNEFNSYCSSLGFYHIEYDEGTSRRYGYKYHRVMGLSKSNSNAYRRQILVHSWYSVTEDCKNQINKPMTCDMRSAGCFTTTDEGYQFIDSLAKISPKKIMIFAFNGLDNAYELLDKQYRNAGRK